MTPLKDLSLDGLLSLATAASTYVYSNHVCVCIFFFSLFQAREVLDYVKRAIKIKMTEFNWMDNATRFSALRKVTFCFII